MPTPVTAPEDRGYKVTVFEPRQKPTQEEVVIDEFELAAGETRDLDYPSATFAYRTEAMGARTQPMDPNFVPPAQEAPPEVGIAPSVTEEINAGKEASAAAQQQQESVPKVKEEEEKQLKANAERKASRDTGEREQPDNKGKPGETTFPPGQGVPNPNPIDRQGQAVNMPDHRRSNPAGPAAPPSLSEPTNPKVSVPPKPKK